MLGMASRILNAMTGGVWPDTLCQRIAMRYGTECLFCKLIGLAVFDRRHCERELNGYED